MKKSLLVIAGLFGMCAGANAQAIASGGSSSSSYFLCSANGDPVSSGANSIGQLGDGTTTNSTTPVVVSGLSDVIAMAGGELHSLFLKSDGTVWSVGENLYGRLGDGTTTDRLTPVQITALSDIIAISAGESHSLFLKSNGTVWACGYNASGQLGDGTTVNKSTPFQIATLSDITAISAGQYFSLFLRSDGTVMGCGQNVYGQLGDGTTGNNRPTPVASLALTDIEALSGGIRHSIFLKNDGTAWATGSNAYGQLGDGTLVSKSTPFQISGLSDITSVKAANHSLFLKDDGTVWACGRNNHGQLGDGTIVNKSTPFQISGLSGITAIAAGYEHSMFLVHDGDVRVCGHNNVGQLCDGTLTERTIPVAASVYCPPVWTGAVSDDWNLAGNWSTEALPTGSDNVHIPSAPPTQPRITLGPLTPAVCADLIVKSGATLIVDAGKALTVSGNLDNEGTILLESDATGNGTLITLGTVGGSGTFTAEQYLTGAGGATPNGRGWYVSPSVSGATSNVFNAAGTDKLWTHTEALEVTGGNGAGYTMVNDNTTDLDPMRGYVLRLGTTQTAEFTGGAFNTGPLSETGLTRTGTTASKRGYHLLGNPYPSFVNWDDVYDASTGLEQTIWYPTFSGTDQIFATYHTGSGFGVNGGTEFIHPHQGFWVRVQNDGETGTIAYTDAMRSHEADLTLRNGGSEHIRLHITDGTHTDETVVYFNDLADNGFDTYDSGKQLAAAAVPQLYSVVDGHKVAINGIHGPVTQPSVPMGIRVQNSGEYTIDATNIDMMVSVYLEDIATGAFQDLNQQPTYAFSSEGGTFDDRFVLHFSAQIVGVDEISSGIDIFSHERNINIIQSEETRGMATIMDMTGRVIQTSSLQGQRTTLTLDVPTGIYLVRVETEKGLETHRVMLR